MDYMLEIVKYSFTILEKYSLLHLVMICLIPELKLIVLVLIRQVLIVVFMKVYDKNIDEAVEASMRMTTSIKSK